MARIAGVNLPNQKRLEVGLTYIYGIGPPTARKVLAELELSPDEKIKDLTDDEGNVIAWESAGSAGFKGSRKSTPFAAQVTADACARKGMEHGLQKVEVFVKGPGSGRETAIRSLQAAGLEILGVKDVTPQAHNGVRPKKRRRV